MQNENLDLTAYTAAHRVRKHHEDGYVDVTGKRQRKWRGWYHVYATKPDGTQTRIKRKHIIAPCSEMTKAEARDEHRAWIRRFNSQPVAESGGATVAQLCDDFVTTRQGDWDERTFKTNRSVFNSLIKPAIGAKRIADVKAEDLKQFLHGLPSRVYKTPKGNTKTGVSQSYVKKAITQLRAVFDLAQERELITKNPTRSISVRLTVPKRATRPNKSVFPPQYLPRLLKQFDAGGRLIVWLAMVPALRPGELFGIRGGDVGPDYIHIRNALDRRRELKDTKTGKARHVHLPADLAKEIQEWMRANGIGPRDYLFTNQVGRAVSSENFLKRKLRPAVTRARIPVLDIDFQMLRRSFATVAGAIGIDVKTIQAQLGHARPDMSLTEYIQPVDDLLRVQMQRLEDILRGRAPMPVNLQNKFGPGSVH